MARRACRGRPLAQGLGGTLVVLAWRNAGWLGLDRWLLPILGTPWQPGVAFRRDRARGEGEYPT